MIISFILFPCSDTLLNSAIPSEKYLSEIEISVYTAKLIERAWTKDLYIIYIPRDHSLKFCRLNIHHCSRTLIYHKRYQDCISKSKARILIIHASFFIWKVLSLCKNDKRFIFPELPAISYQLSLWILGSLDVCCVYCF